MKKTTKYILSALTGLISSLFGAGGGIAATVLFRQQGLSQRQAQASSLCVILPVSIISAAIYYQKGYYNPSDGFSYILPGIAGALTGAFVIDKIPDKLMKKIFAAFMIYCGFNMLVR